MNKKGIIFCGLLTILIGIILTLSFIDSESYSSPTSVYQVYLDGNKIGLIDSKEELYAMINSEQTKIKETYDVDRVYPPKGFKIIEKNTYDEDLISIKEAYDSIKEEKTFTIKGYTITIKSPVDGAEPIYINVLDKKIFEEAVTNIVETFIGNTRYKQYQENTQPEIVETGYIIENMYFNDDITIKESYISVDQTIFTDVQELTKYLLYGENENKVDYIVKQGDTIEKIADDHQLNVEEFLIANDSIETEDTLLAIGDTVNVSLINPILSLVYEELVVEDVTDVTIPEVIEYDPNQYVDYSSVKQEGIAGINRVTSRVQFTNGEQNQGATKVDSVVIREPQTKIIVKGTKKYNHYVPPTVHLDTGTTWGWPTNSPYVITSEYGYRWGTLHDGMDISGTGYGSPIYASLDGTVYQAKWGGIVGNNSGLNVVIQHDNGYFTLYAHCSKLYVKQGERVSRGQKIAAMGATGFTTGPHLHFGVFTGVPYNGGKSINPRRLW